MPRMIAIEGLDGSGKETQAKALHAALQERGLQVATISFPRYGQLSATLVEAYLHGKFGDDPSAVNAYAASGFFAMDRYASYLSEWKSLYDGCDVFLADRYVTSNAIHQCSKLPREQWEGFVAWLFDYEYGKLGLPKPDDVIYLHLPVEEGQRLLSSRYQNDESKKDIHEQDIDYLRRSQEAAEFCATYCGWRRIECIESGSLRSVEDIHSEVLKVLGY